MSNKYTNVMVSSAESLSGKCRFIVRLNGITYGFQSVSGIKVSNDVDYIEEGGVNDHKLLVYVPSRDQPELTFERGLILRSSSILANGIKAALSKIPYIGRSSALLRLASIAAVDPQDALESGPSIGSIEVYSTVERKNLVGLYTFISLGLREWNIDDLNAKDSDILLEKVSVYHTGIKREPLDIKAPLWGSWFRDVGNEISYDESALFGEGRKHYEELEPDTDKKQAKIDELNAHSERSKALKEKYIQNKDALSENIKAADRNRDSLLKDLAEQRKKDKEAIQEKLKEDMKESLEYLETRREEWENLIENGKTTAEDQRKIAQEKAREYQKMCEKLGESIRDTELENFESIKDCMNELHKAGEASRKAAKRATKVLSIKLAKFREEQKLKSDKFAEEQEEIEIAKYNAIKAAEFARVSAIVSRKAVQTLLAKQWDKEKEKKQKELDAKQKDYEERRNQVIADAEKKQSEARKIQEEYNKRLQKIEEAKRVSNDLAEEAEENAAEAEDLADATEAALAST